MMFLRNVFKNLKYKSLITFVLLALTMSGSISFGQNFFFHLLGQGNMPFTWTGASGDHLWSNPNNWSTNQVPASLDTVIFKDSACAGANCNTTIDVNVNISGLSIESPFSGVITQSTTKTITIGTSGYSQASGTFTGSDANITINNILNLSGGTFTTTSATLLLPAGLNFTAGTFNHNNGLVKFDNGSIIPPDSTVNITLPSNVLLYNLEYAGGWNASSSNYKVNITAGSFDVQNQFTIGRTVAGATGAILASGGTINLRGTLIVGPASDAINSTPTNLIMNGASAQTYTATGGRVPKLIIDNANGVSSNPPSTDLVVDGFTLTSGAFYGPPGNLKVAGDFTSAAGTLYIANAGSLFFENLNIASASTNTISLAGLLLTSNLTFGGGFPGSNFSSTWTIAGANPTITASGNLTVGNTKAGGTGSIIINGGTINVTGDYNDNAYSGGGTTNLIVNGVATQNYTKTGSGIPLGGTITINKLGGGFALATNASFNTSGQDLTITQGTMNLLGRNLVVNDVLTIDTNGKIICSGGSATAASYVIAGEVSCGTSVGITWTGLAGNNLWNTAGNWTNNTVPGATDVAVFNSKCSGANCNVTISSALSVRGIRIESDYTGTISQAAGQSMTIGTAGFVQKAGTFVGSNAAITYNGNFALSGGTYTATSATTTFSQAVNFTILGTPIFNHNSGLLFFTSNGGSTSILTIPAAINFNRVHLGGVQNHITIIGELTVNGTLTIDDTYGGGSINTGIISAKGDVIFLNNGKSGDGTLKINGSTNQSITGLASAYCPNLEIASTGGIVTITSSLTLTFSNFTYTSGVVDASTSTFIFTSPGNGTSTIKPGNIDFNNVTISGWQYSQNITGVWKINGLLSLYDQDLYSNNLNGGTIEAKGNVNISGRGKVGSTLLKISGSTNQTITGVGNGAYLPPFEVASSGGIVTFAGIINFSGNYTYTSGVVDGGTSKLVFSSNQTVNLGAVNYNDITFGGFRTIQTITGMPGNVLGTLTLAGQDGYPISSLNSGTINVLGNITTLNWGNNGSTLLRVIGSTNQSINGTAGSNFPKLEIASSGGIVSLSGTITLSGDYTYTSGTIDSTTSTLAFYQTANLTFGNENYFNVKFGGYRVTQTLLGSPMNVMGALSFNSMDNYPATTLNSSSINAYGNVLYTIYGTLGSTKLNFLGASSTMLDIVSPANRGSGDVVVNKTGGAALLLADHAIFNSAGQKMTVTSGTVNMSGNNLTINSTLTVGASGIIKCNGGTLTQGSLVNSGVVDCSPGAFAWNGAGGNTNWNTPGNWVGGVVPGVNDMAIFSNANCGANCNAVINVDPNIKGLRMALDFTGTITQANSVAMTIGSKGWYQLNGSFIGGDSNINVAGSFTLNGGSYRATSGSTSINSYFTVKNNPTFNSNNGTFIMSGGVGGGITSFATAQFYHLIFSGTNGSFDLNNSTLTVNGTLTMGDSVSSAGGINNGNIQAMGDVVFNQNGYVGTALLTIAGTNNSNLTVGASASTLSGIVTINKTGELKLLSNLNLSATNQALSITKGLINLNGNALNVNSALTLSTAALLNCGVGGSYTSGSLVNNGVINCSGYAFNWTGGGGNTNWNTPANWSGGAVPGAGDIAFFSNANCGATCNSTVNINPNIKGIVTISDYTGTITQSNAITISIGTFGWMQNRGNFIGSNSAINISGPFNVLSSAGFISTSGLISFSSDVIVQSTAIFNHNSGSAQFIATTKIVDVRNNSFYDLSFIPSSGTTTFGSTLNVDRNLTIIDDYGGFNPGTIAVKGNVTMGVWGLDSTIGETFLIKLVGSGVQTLSTPGGIFPSIEFASTGTVNLVGTIPVHGNLIYTSGTVNAGTSKISFNPNNLPSTINMGPVIFNNFDFVSSSGDVTTIIGSLNVNGNYYMSDDGIGVTGNILVNGNVTLDNLSFNSSLARIVNFTFAGTGASTLTIVGAPVTPRGLITVNKTAGGSLTLASNVNFAGAATDLNILSGMLDMAGFNLTIGRNINNSGILKRGNSPSCGVLTKGGSLTGTADICP